VSSVTPVLISHAGDPKDGAVSIGEAEIRANRLRARLIGSGAGLLPGLILGVLFGLLVGPLAGVVAGVVAAVAVALVVSIWATELSVRLIGGRPVQEDDEPGLANLVEGLCATFGVPRPRLWLVRDPVPNACSLGRRPSRASLVVTTGLLDRLDLIETEGVVAHELAHIKRHDTAVSETAVVFLYPFARMTGSDRLLHAALGRGREYRADEVAAATVRYPPGLRDALLALESGPAPGSGSVFTGRRWAATRWLWIDPMVGDRDAPLEGALDNTAVRSAALGEW